MEYRNVFLECGFDKDEISKRLDDTFQEIFYKEEAFVSFNNDKSLGYIVDTGNIDVRTEGVSYAMMMCVQMDKKTEFDAIWKWALKYMYLKEGINKGYFAWSVSPDGKKNSDGPAPDGEEFMAMSLIFASHRWGDGKDECNYLNWAKKILKEVVHKGEDGIGRAMWDPDNYLIRFIPDRDFTDPSYHLPHFYELFAEYGNEEDRGFWKKAAAASREFLKKACHPETGLSAEYSYYDGRPYPYEQEIFGRHDWFYSDAYRTIANIALDCEWSRIRALSGDTVKDFEALEYIDFEKKACKNLQSFFAGLEENDRDKVYLIDGKILDQKALHPVALLATTAQASLALEGKVSKDFVNKFWNTPLRSGERRYYDNCLYMFAMLALSGNYRIW
ncbi:MAG: xylanase [Lachnospiraceae bacterium]|nr:xylanase [Lachnospiraceae bacterium]